MARAKPKPKRKPKPEPKTVAPRELSLTVPRGATSCAAEVAQLAAAGQLAHVRTLDLARPVRHVARGDRTIGDLSKLWAAAPELRVLRLLGSGKDVVLGKIVAPQLEELVVESHGLSRGVTAAIAAGTLPKLRHLELFLGEVGQGNTHRIADVVKLLGGANLPALEHLGLVNADMPHPDFIRAIGDSPLLPRLRVLDLRLGVIHDGAFIGKEFEHLEALNLDDNYLRGAFDRKYLPQHVPSVSMRRQRKSEVVDGVYLQWCGLR